MHLSAIQNGNIPLILCGIFYAVLCIFSIVTGLMYAFGRRELNPLEVPDSMLAKMDSEGTKAFARKMGWVTLFVGIVQGITSFSILKAGSLLLYCIAVGFTLFSIASASFKLKGKFSMFPLLKLTAYLAILLVLLIPAGRNLFF